MLLTLEIASTFFVFGQDRCAECGVIQLLVQGQLLVSDQLGLLLLDLEVGDWL